MNDIDVDSFGIVRVGCARGNVDEKLRPQQTRYSAGTATDSQDWTAQECAARVKLTVGMRVGETDVDR